MKRLSILLIILFSLCALSACKHLWGNNDDEEESPFQGMTAQQIYTEGKQKLDKHQYSDAIKRFEALENLYPFNDHAEQANIDLIYAYYKKEDYHSAAASAERFIHLYPRSSRVDYAYYMKGLANFNQPRGALANILPMDVATRDPGTQSQAYSDFATLVQKYPNSPYKPNALQRMIYLRNTFAQRELNAALYGRAQFGDQNMGLIRQQAAVPKLKQEMRVQMLGTLYGELVKNLEFAKLTLMREEPLVQIIDQPILPLPKARLGKLKVMVIGGFLFGFLSLLGLGGWKVWKEITD